MQVEAAPKSAMRGVIHYLLKQWPYLIRYLEYEQLEVSANRAEHNIQSFIMSRKNYQYEYARWYADQRSSTVSLSQQRKTALICTGIYFGFRKVRWYWAKIQAENLAPAKASSESKMLP